MIVTSIYPEYRATIRLKPIEPVSLEKEPINVLWVLALWPVMIVLPYIIHALFGI